MRGRTIPPVDGPTLEDSLSYVQINIYGTNIKELREEGVDVESMLKEIGYRSIIMDVPVLKREARKSSVVKRDLHHRLIHTTSPSQRSSSRRFLDYQEHSGVNVEQRSENDHDNVAEQIWDDNIHTTEETRVLVLGDKRRLNTPSNVSTKVAAFSAELEESDKQTFQDCTDESFGSEVDLNMAAGQPSHKSLASSSVSIRCNTEDIPEAQLDLPQSEMRDDIKEEAIDTGVTNQLEPERSFMEFSRKIIDAIHGSKPNRMPAVRSANPSPPEGQSSSKKEQPEVSTAQDSSCALGDFTTRELNTAHGNGQPGTAAEHDTSFVITDLNSSEVHTCQASLTFASKKRAAEGSDQSCRKYRRRPLRSRSRSKNSDDEEKFAQALEDDSPPSVKSSIKVFHCKYPGCKGKVLWRQGYGKNRLVMHTRLHWRKKTKKCCCCDFVATTEQKVRTHHNNAHTGKKFAGVISLESKADMEELLNLWKDCFPECETDEFCDPGKKALLPLEAGWRSTTNT